MNKYILLLLCVTFLNISFEPPKPPAYNKSFGQSLSEHKAKHGIEKPPHINILVLFDTGGPTSKIYRFAANPLDKGDAMISMLHNGILRNIPIIITRNILISILEAYKNAKYDVALYYDSEKKQTITKKDFLQNIKQTLEFQWKILKNLDEDNFYILLPPTLHDKTLSELGFSQKLFPESSFKSIDEVYKENPIDIDNFNNLFDHSTSIRRRFYVEGHGSSRISEKVHLSKIAQMNEYTYRKFLYKINYLNTDFLLIVSCYAGGYNLEQFHKELSDENLKVFSLTALNYILGIASTTDEISVSKVYINDFFNFLDRYFEVPNIESLTKALQSIHTQSSIASVRFPGSNSLFRVLELDQYIKIITVTNLKIHEMQYKQKGKQPEPLKIDNKKEILLYAGHIKIPLQITSPPGTHWHLTSMINGNTVHIINQMDILESFFTFWNNLLQPISKLSKVFFIKQLYCNEGSLENVCFSASVGRSSYFICKVVSFNSAPEKNGQYILASLQDIMGKNTINNVHVLHEKEALSSMWNLLLGSLPNPLSIYQATGGQETSEMLLNELKQMLRK